MENYNFGLEDLVSNNMNDTNLEYIAIYGLFGRYDIKFPFNRQVNIFIGENGLGKTTILNCIYFVLSKKIGRLADIQFSSIEVKFKQNSKSYKITPSDIRKFSKANRGSTIKYYEEAFLRNHIIDNTMLYLENFINNADTKQDLDIIIYNYARKYDVPIRVARNRIMHYLEDKNDVEKNKGNENKVLSLMEELSNNVKERIIYLPTYRRIEDDFSSLNLQNDELNQKELLIRFGMSDVQSSIDRILEQIQSLAMKGFREMTGVLLKQYADGKDPIKENLSRNEYICMDYNTVKIVLDRVGNEIERSYKEKILELVRSGEIREYNYLYLWNLINKLIDNYKLQKTYDDRIKRFAETCNKYLNDKHFDYNPSTLELDIYLDEKVKGRKYKLQLTELSSGEKQIVSLFSKLYLESNEKSIVIIDEPELSLSLQWQKMLLPDIMRTENCSLLLTVTHSPFIFENEFDFDAKDMRSYIKRTM